MKTASLRSLMEDGARTGTTPLGTYMTSFDAAVSVVLADVGFDYLIVDCEHGPMDKVSALNHVRAAKLHGAAPVARCLENSSQTIQSFFDIGVTAVIVPKVEDAATARRIAAMARYQPGGRGMCPGCDAARYSTDNWAQHVEGANAVNMVVPLIETQEGIRNLKDIAAVDGIDLLFFGPGDLSQDMGLSMFNDADRLMDLWEEFKTVVHAAGKRTLTVLGYGFEGADVGVYGMDMMMLRQEASNIVRRFKGDLPLGEVKG